MLLKKQRLCARICLYVCFLKQVYHIHVVYVIDA